MARGGVRKILKWAGMILSALIVLIVVALIFVYWRSGSIVNQKVEAAEIRPLAVPTDSASVAWGGHLVNCIVGCADCHGEHFEGMKLIDDPVFARLYAPNITRGNGGYLNDISSFERAVRHGIRHDGTSLWIMPSYHYNYLNDGDLAAIYAYLKTVPPMNQTQPDRKMGPIARMLVAQGKLPVQVADLINHDAPRPPKPKAEPTVEYGQYLARVSCIGCHGPNLSGGPIFGADPTWPPSSNLTRGGIAAQYSEKDFVTALREGRRPGGAALNPIMPWKSTRGMSDDEIHALWLYVQSAPPAAYASGNWAGTKTP
jgi:mono/diheme cytochrome c family protein